EIMASVFALLFVCSMHCSLLYGWGGYLRKRWRSSVEKGKPPNPKHAGMLIVLLWLLIGGIKPWFGPDGRKTFRLDGIGAQVSAGHPVRLSGARVVLRCDPHERRSDSLWF